MIEPDLFISTKTGDKEAVEALNGIFEEAANMGAADIHFQEQEGKLYVRYRLDGVLHDRYEFDQLLAQDIDSKIRMRSKIEVSDRRGLHDGRMRLRFPERSLDVRVSITPNIAGQNIVCRLLDKSNASRRLSDIEMTVPVRHVIDSVIAEPNGLFLVTGPTGSGKTTTLYAVVNELNDPSRHIVTIENPVEYQVARVTQINVDEKHIGFADALRSVLRQDPDVVLVGEIRDAETAKIAVQAANTGHLVLATLHTNSAASAVMRLLDLGVDPVTLSAALRGVIAQRLVRKLTGSVVMGPPSETEAAWLEANGVHHHGVEFAKPGEGGGYSGRVPVIELIMSDAYIRHTLSLGDQTAINQAAMKQPQFETLASAGARMAMRGLTSLDEVRRITSGNDVPPTGVNRFGSVMVALGYITPVQLEQAVAQQSLLKRRGLRRQLGEVLIEMDACTRMDVLDGLGHVQDSASQIVEGLLRQGVLDEDDHRAALGEWRVAGGSLFEILVRDCGCSWEDIDAISGLAV